MQGSQIAELAASCLGALDAQDAAMAADLAAQLEAAQPASRAEWQAVDHVFRRLGKQAWVEIMLRRFLAVAPGDVEALLADIGLQWQVYGRFEQAQAMIDAMAPLAEASAPWFIRLAQLALACRDPARASSLFRRALALQPSATEAAVMLIHISLTRGDTAQAKTDLAVLRSAGRGALPVLIAVMTFALRLQDAPFALETLKQALPLLPPGDATAQATLTTVGFRSGGRDLAEPLLRTLDVAAVANAAPLAELYAAIEGAGYHDREQALVARLLVLDPYDKGWRRISEAQRLATLRPFALNAVAPPPPTPTPQPGHFARRLRFWR